METEGYTRLHRDRSGQLPCPWHTRGFMSWHHLAPEDTTTHVSFTISFHVYSQRAFPLTNETGHRCTHRNCVWPHKSVWQTDWTTQHTYPTVKCTKQLQIIHVTRTVTAGRGPECACRQRMVDSCPCLIWVSSLTFRERKSKFGFLLCALFRVGVHNRFFWPGSRKSICSCGQILKIAPFIHSKRVFSKNLDYFQGRPIQSSYLFCIFITLHDSVRQTSVTRIVVPFSLYVWFGKGQPVAQPPSHGPFWWVPMVMVKKVCQRLVDQVRPYGEGLICPN